MQKDRKPIPTQDAPPGLRAGVAKVDITTPTRPGDVHDPLFAKALVLEDGETTLVLLALDAVAIGLIGDVPDTFLPALRRRVRTRLGIPDSHILVHATHTHPSGRMLCGPRELLDRAFEAVERAHRNRTGVTLGSGSGRENRLMINRTLRLKDGSGWTVRQAYPCPPDDRVARVGVTDPEIGVLRLDRLDGRPLAVVVNYAGHPLLGVPGGAVTANYPGFACDVMEEQLGHGAMVLFLQGAGGNLTEVLYKDVQRPRDARPVGRRLGLSALKAWRTIRTGPATLDAVTQTVRLPLRKDAPKRIAALLKRQARLLASLRFTSLNFRAFLPLYLKHALNPEFPSDYAYRYLQEEQTGSDDLRAMDAENKKHIEKYLANLRAMEELSKIEDDLATLRLHDAQNRAFGKSHLEIEVQGFRIGGVAVVTSPLELFVEVGLRMKKTSPFPRTFVAAFSNGYLHYGVPVGEDRRGGYEAAECMLDSAWQAIHETATRAVLRTLAKRMPAVEKRNRLPALRS